VTDTPTTATVDRIAVALARATQSLDDLSAMSATREAAGLRREIRSLTDALQSEMGADDFRREGNLVRWLPAILDYEQVADNRIERLRRLAGALARSSNIWPVRSHTWTYLSLLAFLVLLLFLFLSSTILPVFDAMFKEFGLKLPWVTTAVLWLGSWIGPSSHVILLIVFSSWLLIRLGRRLMRRLSQDQIQVSYWQRLGFSNSESLIAMSRFTHALACLLRIDVAKPEAIMIAGRACSDPTCLQNAIRMSVEIKRSPANLCPTARCFPPLVIEALREDGMARGKQHIAIEMLRELSQVYADRVMHRRELVVDFLLPVALVLFGLSIGIIVLSLFLPLVSLISSLA
jgi:type IV pilus assembly protein PilC